MREPGKRTGCVYDPYQYLGALGGEIHVAEHFLVHNLAHYLHLSDVYLASVFACIMGMFFHPIKEKFIRWMKHFERTVNYNEVSPGGEINETEKSNSRFVKAG